MTIIKFIVLHFIVLTLTVFLLFWNRENGDSNSATFGTIVYLPYVALLAIINFAFVLVGRHYLFKSKYLTAILTTIVWTIIFFANLGHFRIHYWTISVAEFIILNVILIVLNLAGLFIWTTA